MAIPQISTILLLLFVSLISATPASRQIRGSATPTTSNPFCTGFCFTSISGRRQAEAACRNRQGCSVVACSRESRFGQREGFSCFPAPPTEITEGPIELPSVIQFPDMVLVGGTVEVEVTVNVDEVSSASREDFYLLSDATGSMSGQIAEVQADFERLIQARRNASGSVAFGVGFYRDEADTPTFMNLQGLTEDLGKVRTAIAQLEAKDGGDTPEANLYGLRQVATRDEIGWRTGTRRILTYFGDAPGHEPSCLSGDRLTREDVIDDLNEQGIAVIATNFGNINSGLNGNTFSPPSGPGSCGPTENTRGNQGTEIAEGTAGELILASDPRELIDVIVEAVQSLDQELSAITTDCDGKVEIEFDPMLPIRIAAGETRTIMETARILPGACAEPDGFTCEIDIQLSGVGVRQVIQTTTIAGCEAFEGLF